MKIKLLTIGRARQPFYQKGVVEYLKRLKGYTVVELVEVPDEPLRRSLSPANERQVMEKEALRALERINAGDFVIALDRKGRQLSSEELAKLLEDRMVSHPGYLVFVVGGALGLGKPVLDRADMVLSLSRMTFPHGMVPLILLEQVYRACRIIRGEPYHR